MGRLIYRYCGPLSPSNKITFSKIHGLTKVSMKTHHSAIFLFFVTLVLSVTLTQAADQWPFEPDPKLHDFAAGLPYEEIIVQLYPDSESGMGPGRDDRITRLMDAAGTALIWSRETRTGGQVLKLPDAMDREDVEKILRNIRTAAGVLWAEPVPPQAMQQALAQDAAQSERTAYTQQIIVKFTDPETQHAAQHHDSLADVIIAGLSQMAGTPLDYARPMSDGAHVFNLPYPVTLSEARTMTQRLEASPEVQYADPVTTLQPLAQPNDPLYPQQWHYFESAGGANLPPAWDLTIGSPNVAVAVLDTGILPHPDLAGHVLPGYDMISDVFVANDGNGRDSDPTDPGDWQFAGECGPGSPPLASSWHGTHVAGTIGAASNNGVGVAGVSGGSPVLPVRGLGKCGGLLSDIIDSIYWAAGSAVPGVPANSNPAKVINMSLGGTGRCGSSTQAAINAALARGAVVIVAAGNENTNAANATPGNCFGVITVAANNRSGDRAYYSNYGLTVEISASGGDMRQSGFNGILSTYNTGQTTPSTSAYAFLQGTSMAAPHVAGLAALMFSVNPSLTSGQVLTYIQNTAQPFQPGTQCASNPGACGVGIINAAAAVQVASQGGSEPAGSVFEFYNINLNHYFITASAGEAAGIDGGAAGPGWVRTGLDFKAYPLQASAPGAVPVCRFYGTPGRGPNSHFYTADAGECEQVKRDPGWTYEGIAFSIRLPISGNCPAGTQPVYRVYNNRWMINDSNHRYTINFPTYQDMIRQGWLAEGVVMCAPL